MRKQYRVASLPTSEYRRISHKEAKILKIPSTSGIKFVDGVIGVVYMEGRNTARKGPDSHFHDDITDLPTVERLLKMWMHNEKKCRAYPEKYERLS